jgi:polyisoprenoid-binding protein YceI
MQRIKPLAILSAALVLMSFTLPEFNNDNNHPTTLSPVRATSFVVDNQQSKLTWLAKKVTGEHTGTINVAEGTLEVDNKTLKSGNFSLDTRSIAVTDIKDAGMNSRLVGHLKSDDFFSVEKFPTAGFVISSVTDKGKGVYEVNGQLTIKGITNPISFPATVNVSGNKLTAKAAIKVDRTKYDIKFRSKSFFENLGDKTIYDDFELNVLLVANAK